jgi:hypothetical protein
MYGLTYLVSNYQNSRQQMFLDANGDNSGAALDVTASSANEHKLINTLHKALEYVEAGKGGFDSFAGAPIVDVGLKADQSTEIIANTEGTGGASTSVYIARWDATDGAIGVQKAPIGVYDPLEGREMESLPAHLLRCDWGCMIVPRSDYCIARIGGIANPANWTIPA